MMTYTAKTGGYSLIEVLIAITILLVAIVGPMTIAATGLKNAKLAQEQNTALFFAQEGIEKMTQFHREYFLSVFVGGSSDTWNQWLTAVVGTACGTSADGCVIKDGFYLESYSCAGSAIAGCRVIYGDRTIAGQHYYITQAREDELNILIDGTETNTPYTRQIFVSNVGGALEVRSVVSWNSGATGDTERVELQSYLYNIYDL